MKTVGKLRCASCKRKITRSEPDLVLRDDTTARVLYYHVGCGAAAVAKVSQRPGVYFLTHRYIEAEAN
jgi:hypothetical protein